jgi:hypothetical protein
LNNICSNEILQMSFLLLPFSKRWKGQFFAKS